MLYTRKRKRGNHEPRTLSISPAFRYMLERRNLRRTADLVFPTRYGTPQPRSRSFLVGLFSRNCHKTKVSKFTAHGIRHHVATRLKDSRQATSYQIQAFLGHMNHSTTERYLHDLAVDRDVPHLLTLEGVERKDN